MGTPTVREGRCEAGLRNSKLQTEDGKTQFSLLPSRRAGGWSVKRRHKAGECHFTHCEIK